MTNPDTTTMKPILINAGILTALFVGLWIALDIPLRGYSSPPETAANDAFQSFQTAASPPQSHEALMNDGLALLYTQNDPKAAASTFSDVLAQDTAHYGARFQHAKALDSAQDLEAALSAWSRFLPMAEASRDEESLAWATERIDALNAAINECNALMEQGISLLHTEQNAHDAADAFSTVLARWPTHYGAAYQRAQALERDGQAETATRAWEQVMEQAQQIDAGDDVAAARAAIARLQAATSEP